MADNVEKCLERFNQDNKSYKQVWKKVKNHEDTEDVLQEILIKIVEKYDTINLETFERWISTVACNQAISYQRQTRKHKQCASLTLANITEEKIAEKIGGCQDAQPELEAEQAENRKLLHACLRQLSDDDANLIRLHYLDELSYAEIGEKLGRPMNTIKSKVRRSLAKLRIMLQASGLDETNY